MRKIALLPVVTSITLFLFFPLAHAGDLKLDDAQVQVYFSPDDKCTHAIVKEIIGAKSEVFLQAYAFTSDEIAAALVQAHKKGVHVELILDKSNRSAKYTAGDVTAGAGIPTYIDSRHAIANNKIMIIDGRIVITGSFNFTKAAEEKNAENILIIRNKDVAEAYLGNWQRHKVHVEEFVRR